MYSHQLSVKKDQPDDKKLESRKKYCCFLDNSTFLGSQVTKRPEIL